MLKEQRDLQDLVTLMLSLFPEEFMKLNADEQRVSIQVYQLLAEGRPVSVKEIATALALPEDHVTTILKGWPGVYYDDEERIIGFWGLALPEMTHRFEIDGRTLYTWCAWDSLFIPELIKKTAHVESPCPVTRNKIRLTVTPEGVQHVEPAGAVMSFVRPAADKIREDVILNFCHYIYFFSSDEAGSQWISENTGTFLLSIKDAHYLGRKKNEARYKEVLGLEKP